MRIMRSIIKHKSLRICLLAAVSFFLSRCFHLDEKEYLSPSVSHFFDELQIKEYSQMEELIQPLIQKHQLPSTPKSSTADILDITDDISEEDYLMDLRKAFLIALSRPPRGSAVQRLIQKIRRNNYAHKHFYSILTHITQQACTHIKNKNRSPRERATYFYVLENIISEVRPYFEKNKEALKILEWIQEARIGIPDSVHKERYIRSLEPQTSSPSELAYNLLKPLRSSQ